jgi:hypothetical protein
MTHPLFSRTTGWFTLAALLALSPELAGCDTSAPSAKESTRASSVEVKEKTPPVETKTEAQKLGAASRAASTEPAPGPAVQKDSNLASATSGVIPDAAPVIKRFIIASDVAEREPIALADGKVTEPVVAFLELGNKADAESGVVITFEHESGRKVGFIELSVPAETSRYRTWGRTRNIQQPGEWTAIVSSKSGEELARKTFTVTG